MESIKRKRALAILLAVLMTVSAAACMGKKGSEKSAVKPVEITGNVSKDAGGESEVFEYTWVGYSYSPVLAKGEDAVIQNMIEKKYNIKLTPVFVDRSKYAELMNLKFASNEIPDVFTADNAVLLGKWVSQGVLAEIKQQDIRTYAPDLWADIESMSKIDPNVTKYTIVNNKNYGLQLTSIDATYRPPVIWRTDWLDKLGISKIPETLKEFETALYKIALEDPDGDGKKNTYGCNATGLDTIYGISGYIPTAWAIKDGKVVWGGIQPEVKEVLAMFRKWYSDGVIDPEFVTGENQGGYWATSQPFINGRIGLSSLGSYYHWNAPYFDDQDWTSTNGKLFKEIQGAGARYDFGKPAVGADGKTGMYAYSPATGITVCGVQMEKNPEKIYRFLKSQNGFCEDLAYFVNVKYGVKGLNYTIDNHGMIKSLDTSSLPEEKRAVAVGGGFSFMNYHSMKWCKELSKEQYAFADKVASDARIIDACSGSLPSQAKFKAGLDKLQNTTFIGIITGSIDINEFDEFVEKWTKQGGEQLTREANEWRKNIESIKAE